MIRVEASRRRFLWISRSRKQVRIYNTD